MKMAISGLVLLLLVEGTLAQYWLAHDYWNDRYGIYGLTPYDSGDTVNGLWSDYIYNKDNYGDSTSSYSKPACQGCSCNTATKTVSNCRGSVVILRKQNFSSVTAETFTSTAITSITITDCDSFDTIGKGTFLHLVNLQELTIQFCKITTVPDFSFTKLRTLNLGFNEIKITTDNEIPQVLPTTLERLCLVRNKIHWVPDSLLAGPNLKIVALGDNEVSQFPTNAIGKMPRLQYFGLNKNLISEISANNIRVLATNAPHLQHLNLSNNALRFIEQRALSQLKDLLILELHQNEFTTLEKGMIDNIPKLLHVDLNNNRLQVLTSHSITNLPEVITIRLHSQKKDKKMTTIMYDSLRNVNQKLQYLWVSDNALDFFPHEMLIEQVFTNMHTIWADHNQISSVATFVRQSYPLHMQAYYDQQLLVQKPFATVKNLRGLYLHNNRFTHTDEEDFCQLQALRQLYLYNNQLTDIHENTFNCTPALQILDIGGNLIQYVPAAVKSPEKMPSIQSLRMSSNKITFVEKEDFRNLTTLTELYLGNNNILTIENCSFPDSIRHLDLYRNSFRFQHENPFNNLPNLYTLNLGYNDIDYLPDEAFHNDTSLNSLYLNNNRLGRLMRVHIKDAPLTGFINFANNDLAFIEDGTFEHVKNAYYLYLHNNKLTRLPDLHDMYLTWDLNVQNNRITTLQTGLLKNFRAYNIIFQNNKIDNIESNAFNDVTSALDTILTGNPLKDIAAGAFNKTQHR